MCHMLIRRFFFSPQDFKARNQTLISLHSRDFVCQMRYLQKLLFFLFVFWDVLTMLLLAYMIAFVQVWQGGEGWAMSDQLGILGLKKT